MDRRDFIGAAGASALALFHGGEAGAQGPGRLPERNEVRVAFLLGDQANVIDTFGPWEVFQDTQVPGLFGRSNPFRLYTVGPDRDPVRMTGGLTVLPRHTIGDAPPPHLIVVPAQTATDAARDWLKAASAEADVTLSICTGAFQLARAGLLDGLRATTHHQFWDSFARQFPGVDLHRGLRFIDNGRIATAGGLTSGIDLALHIVQRYYGPEVAAATAAYMEYAGEGWRTPA
ncbi:MAG TPA: DJ-1/PfpI family protein [Azospirillaceae bacterium]|nr:DJ-1/PfpI family protein [Azospirillaceae bacterium]